MLAQRDRWLEALSMFADGRYLEALESFETLWRSAKGTEREFQQGWELLAAALFHRDRGNPKGSRLCFERARQHWRNLPPVYRGIAPPAALEAVGEVLSLEWANPELPWPHHERRESSERGRGERP